MFMQLINGEQGKVVGELHKCKQNAIPTVHTVTSKVCTYLSTTGSFARNYNDTASCRSAVADEEATIQYVEKQRSFTACSPHYFVFDRVAYTK
ncbi:hypothetical protein NPIL_564191 [Nephila pilipes]|uniref:Uncharacterized protein n=1 Tax=Nephila pilipes TaxID=299642 RepID=A0A8X6PPP0_NEPPI|nr:hypothetical protein NPIL_564191 [Nephila pilipes]